MDSPISDSKSEILTTAAAIAGAYLGREVSKGAVNLDNSAIGNMKTQMAAPSELLEFKGTGATNAVGSAETVAEILRLEAQKSASMSHLHVLQQSGYHNYDVPQFDKASAKITLVESFRPHENGFNGFLTSADRANVDAKLKPEGALATPYRYEMEQKEFAGQRQNASSVAKIAFAQQNLLDTSRDYSIMPSPSNGNLGTGKGYFRNQPGPLFSEGRVKAEAYVNMADALGADGYAPTKMLAEQLQGKSISHSVLTAANDLLKNDGLSPLSKIQANAILEKYNLPLLRSDSHESLFSSIERIGKSPKLATITGMALLGGTTYFAYNYLRK